MAVMVRRVGLAALSVAVVVVLWLAGVWAVAYYKAPRLVAELEESGALPFDPAVLPAGRVCALVAVQDRTFFRHHGIGLLDGPPLHTTMTQSICKGLFFRGFSPGPLRYRKIMLMVDALAFDHRVSKEMQLRIFMNRAFFGRADGAEVLGFESAAKAYFGRDILQLSDQEYLALVVMLLAPSKYGVAQEPEANAARVRLFEGIVDAACPADCIEKPPHAPCGSAPDDRGGPTRDRRTMGDGVSDRVARQRPASRCAGQARQARHGHQDGCSPGPVRRWRSALFWPEQLYPFSVSCVLTSKRPGYRSGPPSEQAVGEGAPPDKRMKLKKPSISELRSLSPVFDGSS
jgi:hypothetical protein